MDMTMPDAGVPVTLAPFPLEPDRDRREFSMPAGMRVSDIVDQALDKALIDLPEEAFDRVRVVVIGNGRADTVPRDKWHLVRPAPHAAITITIAPGDPGSALLLLVQAAASYLAPLGGAGLAGTFGLTAAAWTGIIGFGITALGGLLVNALFNPGSKKKKEDRASYVIDRWQNEGRLDQQVPVVFGQTRHAPPFAAAPYVEVVGDWLYTRAILCNGIGKYDIWDQKIGDTLLSDYKNVQVEHRNVTGHPDSTVQFTLYPQQVYEDPVRKDLELLLKRTDTGAEAGGWEDPEPVRRTSGRGTHAMLIFSFPTGLVEITHKGKKNPFIAKFDLRIRKTGTPTWIDMPEISIRARKSAAFYRAIRVDFPETGAYEIEVARTSRSEFSQDEEYTWACATQWMALQTFRPEYPVNVGTIPMSMTALRIKATHQLNGGIETYNHMQRLVTDDFGNGWPTDMPRNPATSALYNLLGPCLVKPRTAAQIDWPKFEEWRNFCADKDLKFDLVVNDQSFDDVRKAIGSAGRAAIYHDGSKWTLNIDKPRDHAVSVLTPRNSSDVSFETFFPDVPDAIRIKFQDASNDYEAGERMVLRPGFSGSPRTTEAMEMPGVTDPVQIYREGVRRFYEMQYRSTTYSATQRGPIREAGLGDLVVASHDIMRKTLCSAKVKAVRGRQIEFDDLLEFEAGKTYAASFFVREEIEPDHFIQKNVIRPVSVIAGGTKTALLSGEGYTPESGDVVIIGEHGLETLRLIMTGAQQRDDGQWDEQFLPAAEIIDELTDAAVIPLWDGKYGELTNFEGFAPLVPRIGSIVLDTATGEALVTIQPDAADVVPISGYNMQWRLVGESVWQTVTADANGLATITGRTIGDHLELMVQAVGFGDPAPTSAWSSVITATLTGTPLPLALPEASIAIIGGLGSASITFATGSDVSTTGVRVNRDGSPDGESVTVSPSSTFTVTNGDATRVNIVAYSTFDPGGSGDPPIGDIWIAGTGWTIASSKAAKTAGVASSIEQDITMSAGKTYRGAVVVAGRTAGSLTPQIEGATTVSASAVAANGRALFSIVAPTAPETLSFAASADFDGSIDSVVLFEETTACIAQGNHDYSLTPLNDDDAAGPTSAVRTVTVI